MSNSVKYYLAGYNLIAFIFWAAFLISYFISGFTINSTNLFLLNIAQGLAVMEIFHALLKWVKSPIASTVAQVFSRILVLVLINVFLSPEPVISVDAYGILIVSIAWGLTELVRYSLYFLSLFGLQPVSLLWMRYSFFIILYPLGVTGEWLILLAPLIAGGIALNAYNVFLIIAFLSYVYYFPVLYKYMWKQRRLKLQ